MMNGRENGARNGNGKKTDKATEPPPLPRFFSRHRYLRNVLIAIVIVVGLVVGIVVDTGVKTAQRQNALQPFYDTSGLHVRAPSAKSFAANPSGSTWTTGRRCGSSTGPSVPTGPRPSVPGWCSSPTTTWREPRGRWWRGRTAPWVWGPQCAPLRSGASGRQHRLGVFDAGPWMGGDRHRLCRAGHTGYLGIPGR